MKKLLVFIMLITCCLCLLACEFSNVDSQIETTSIQKQESVMSEEEIVHEHSITKIEAVSSTCTKRGNIEFYFCWGCSGYFLDENAEQQITVEETKTGLLPHNGEKQEEIAPTCGESGVSEHWICSECGGKFADEQCTERTNAEKLEIPSLAHQNMEHRESVPVVGDQNGTIEHWYCEDCDGYFLDEEGLQRVEKEDTVLLSVINIPDFIVNVPSGKDVVVLQLTDTQIIDGAQARPDVSSGDKITYATDKIPQYCYDYLTETIEATNPDLIIITGDIVYGKYDDNGSVLVNFIAFMESFEIPWAPVFGNHDNESAMGADWQCEQFEKAQFCLFKQGNLTGNGNYSVGICQDGVLKRVFYMLDSNGCSDASSASMLNGQTTSSVGFGEDQIEWYTNQIQRLKELSPQTKISFAFHIQLAVFGEALTKYGFDNSKKNQEIHIDYLENRREGDFGYIGRQMKDAWDGSKRLFSDMKALGVDSIFVGHEHCNNSSVVYEGVRLQYGQKSSEYDRYNAVSEEGKIVETAIWKKVGTPYVGGSVIVLSSSSGEIVDSYIYYCDNADDLVNPNYYN
ncbi:MAG: metallophosphoesterase [Clostridia bacterium]|nr:metallophosphoesterase [Clostridia bacterium]